jgi:hypothetical protein
MFNEYLLRVLPVQIRSSASPSRLAGVPGKLARPGRLLGGATAAAAWRCWPTS